MEHHLLPAIAELAGDTQPIHVHLVGCGGNGSQMLTGLARLHTALRALGQAGLQVCAYDPEAVSPANVARQLFSPADVGRNKAAVLVTRLNAFFGMDWVGVPSEFKPDHGRVHLLISCVDTRATRAEIHYAITSKGFMRSRTPAYWMDLGNRERDGQFVLGCPASGIKWANDKTRLPTVAELLPEIIRRGREDNAPSCSLAEALERQHLFVNQAVVTPALQILWQLLRFGKITWHGAFVNLATGHVRPLPVDPAAWARMRGHQPKEKK